VPKKYRVDITASAEADIVELWDYIAQENPDSATAFILRMEEQIGTLEQFPARCPLIPENELLGTQYRQMLFGPYRTIFSIIGSRVIILRVIHGARLLDMEMFDSGRKS
jgi:toxin ParE1/3/4